MTFPIECSRSYGIPFSRAARFPWLHFRLLTDLYWDREAKLLNEAFVLPV